MSERTLELISQNDARWVDLRFTDLIAHPYLAFSAMLMAGIDGIQNKIHPGEPDDRDLYNLTAEEEASANKVASSFEVALNALDSDRTLLTRGEVFSDDMLDAYVELKLEEVERLNMTTHPVEFDMYYSV